MKKCAFTGHRPQRLPFGADEADERCIRLKQVLREQIIHLIEEDGISYCICGLLFLHAAVVKESIPFGT